MVETTAEQEKQLVVFNLGKETYAVDITTVREIIQTQPITRVPGTPPSVEGVINLRGSIIPIVDLRKRFRLKVIERDKDTRIIVVSCKNHEVGVIVDSVTKVLRIPIDSIKAVSSVFHGEHLEHLTGIVRLSDRLVILLDLDLVLTSQEIAAIDSLERVKPARGQKTQPVAAGKK